MSGQIYAEAESRSKARLCFCRGATVYRSDRTNIAKVERQAERSSNLAETKLYPLLGKYSEKRVSRKNKKPRRIRGAENLYHKATFPPVPKSSVADAMPNALKTLLMVGSVIILFSLRTIPKYGKPLGMVLDLIGALACTIAEQRTKIPKVPQSTNKILKLSPISTLFNSEV